MTKKDWTEQLREQLADYKAEVPEGLWADIEQRLPQQKPVVAHFWQRWVSIAALVALLLGIGWWQWSERQAFDKLLTEKKQDLRENPVRTGRTESSYVTDQEFAPYGLKHSPVVYSPRAFQILSLAALISWNFFSAALRISSPRAATLSG